MTTPLDLVNLTPLMERMQGKPEITIGLIDGPISMSHPDLSEARIREIPGRLVGTCVQASSAACQHETFVAGILAAKRGSIVPAICPGASLAAPSLRRDRLRGLIYAEQETKSTAGAIRGRNPWSKQRREVPPVVNPGT
jgi:hypothetical protein